VTRVGVVRLVAPESTIHLVTGVGGASTTELKEVARDCGSHYLNNGVGGGDYCDEARGRGRGATGDVNGGPSCCTQESY
jgi:hypothetical protein